MKTVKFPMGGKLSGKRIVCKIVVCKLNSTCFVALRMKKRSEQWENHRYTKVEERRQQFE